MNTNNILPSAKSNSSQDKHKDSSTDYELPLDFELTLVLSNSQPFPSDLKPEKVVEAFDFMDNLVVPVTEKCISGAIEWTFKCFKEAVDYMHEYDELNIGKYNLRLKRIEGETRMNEESQSTFVLDNNMVKVNIEPMTNVKNELNIELLIERIKSDHPLLTALKNTKKPVTLFLGRSNAGKTTLICFLKGSTMELKTAADGTLFLDTLTPDAELKIGHTNDSQTKHLGLVDVGDQFLLDSCGFEDTEGFTVDVANAVTLRRTIMECHEIRIVILIDVRTLDTDKGSSFTKTLTLISRFFSPAEKFLPSLSFFFTHAASGLSPSQLVAKLEKFENANYVNADKQLITTVKHIKQYVMRLKSQIIITCYDLGQENPKLVREKRNEIKSVINQATSLSNVASLGSPISDEAVIIVKEKCQDLYLTSRNGLRESHFADTKRGLEKLHLMKENMKLLYVDDYYNRTIMEVQSHVTTLYQAVEFCLEEKNFEKLKRDLSVVKDACVLDGYCDVTRNYNAQIKSMIAVAEQLVKTVTDRVNRDDKHDVKVLDQLKTWKESFYLIYSERDYYTEAVNFIEDQIAQCGKECKNFLNGLKRAVEDKYDSEVQIVFPYFTTSTLDVKDPVDVFNYKSFGQWMSRLNSAELYKVHVSTEATSHYIMIRNSLDKLMKSVKDKFAKFSCSIRDCVLQDEEAERLFRLFILVDGCYRYSELNDVFSHSKYIELQNLNEIVNNDIQDILLSHFRSIDILVEGKEYKEIIPLLRTALKVRLTSTKFSKFKAEYVFQKTNIIASSVKNIFDDCFERLKNAQSRNDFRKVFDLVCILQSAIDFDNLLSWISNEDMKNVSVSSYIQNLIREVNELWMYRMKDLHQILQTVTLDSDQAIPKLTSVNNLIALTPYVNEVDYHNQINEIKLVIESSTESLIQVTDIVNAIHLLIFAAPWVGLLKEVQNSEVFLTAIESKQVEIRNWVVKLRDRVEGHKDSIKGNLQVQINAVESIINNSLSNRSFMDIVNRLDFLQELLAVDKHFDPTPSQKYFNCCNYLNSVIESNKDKVLLAVERQELAVAADLISFFTEAEILSKHFPNFNFRQLIENMKQNHVASVGNVSEVIKNTIDSSSVMTAKLFQFFYVKFKDLAPQGRASIADDPHRLNVFDQCDNLVSDQLKLLQMQNLSIEEEDFTDQEFSNMLQKLLEQLKICDGAMSLVDIVTESPTKSLSRIYVDVTNMYDLLCKKIQKHLKAYDFIKASKYFRMLQKFKQFDNVLDKWQVYIEDFSSFISKIEHFTDKYIRSLSNNLANACNYFITLTRITDKSGGEFYMKEETESMNVQMESTMPTPAQMLRIRSPRELTKLLESVVNAADSVDTLFNDIINFNNLCDQMKNTFLDHFKCVRIIVDDLMKNKCYDHTRVMLETQISYFSVGEVVIDPYSVTRLKMEFEQRLAAANEMQTTGALHSFRFEFSCLEAEKIRLRLARNSNNYHLFLVGKNHIHKIFEEQSTIVKQLMDKRQIIDYNRIFDFFLALAKYEEILQESSELIPSQCDQCWQSFRNYLITDFLELQRKVKARTELETAKAILVNIVVAVKKVCTLIKGVECQRIDIVSFLDELTNQGEQLILEAQSVTEDMAKYKAEFGSYDLFIDKNTQITLNRLNELSRQGNTAPPPISLNYQPVEDSYSEIQRKISNQLLKVKDRVREFLIQENFEVVVNGYRNATILKDHEIISSDCENAMLTIRSELNSYQSRLNDRFKLEIKNKRFADLEKTINTASEFDKIFLGETNYFEDFKPLMEGISLAFTTDMDKFVKEQLTIAVTPKHHAEVLCYIKQMVSEISNSSIHKLAYDKIKDLLNTLGKSKAQDFIFQLGIALSSLGRFGEEIVESYPQFEALLAIKFNKATQGLTTDDALNRLQQLNSSITPQQLDNLRKYVLMFDDKFEDSLKRYLKGYQLFSTADVKALIFHTKSEGYKLRGNFSQEDLVNVLAGIFASWTILKSQRHFESTRDKNSLIKPHVVQLIAIFRLLGIDQSRDIYLASYLVRGVGRMLNVSISNVEGHMIQVGTGEGKSILLGGLSCLLGILGYDIYCASYSKHLSKRDEEYFMELFEAFDVKQFVHYSTLQDLVEQVIDLNGDVRELTSTAIRGRNYGGKSQPIPNRKRILLIDEVDVFFSKDFYGNTHNPFVYYTCDETVAIMKAIWQNRKGNFSIDEVKRMPEYSSLLQRFCPEAESYLNQQINLMFQHLASFNDPSQHPPYIVKGTAAEGKKLAYKILDSTSSNIYYGYRTAFAYLNEAEKDQAGFSLSLNNVLGLRLNCGVFSYAEIPKYGFESIMGVTGTLSCLSESERDIINNDYHVTATTITPSMYGDSKLVFKEDVDVIVESDKARYHQTISRIILEESAKSRPVIVYFESNEELFTFLNGEYGKALTADVVNEETENVQYYVNRATDAGRVTLFTKEFGRGLNFVTRSPDVENAGGMLVIQTFFSDFESEEIQIKGRTARQSKYGSYKLILFRDNLVDQFQSVKKLVPNTVEEESKKSTFYTWLKELRSQLTASRIQSLKDRAQEVLPLHKNSMQFLELIQAKKTNRAGIIKSMLSFTSTSQFVHVIFCLDESGSMLGPRWESLKIAYREFLSIRRDAGGSAGDKISVIQFASTARTVVNKASLEIAYNQDLKLIGGGTSFVPALQAIKQQLASDYLDAVVVFMTDGECAESDSVLIASAREVITAHCSGSIQFFAVALSLDSQCDRLKNMTNAVGGTVVSATGLNDLREKFKYIAREVSASYGRP